MRLVRLVLERAGGRWHAATSQGWRADPHTHRIRCGLRPSRCELQCVCMRRRRREGSGPSHARTTLVDERSGIRSESARSPPPSPPSAACIEMRCLPSEPVATAAPMVCGFYLLPRTTPVGARIYVAPRPQAPRALCWNKEGRRRRTASAQNAVELGGARTHGDRRAQCRAGGVAAAANPSTAGDVAVYVLRTPLEGLEAVGNLLGDAYPDLWHYAVLLSSKDAVVVLDFLPRDALSPVTAMRYAPLNETICMRGRGEGTHVARGWGCLLATEGDPPRSAACAL